MTLVQLDDPRSITFGYRGDYAPDERPIITVEFAAVDSDNALTGTYTTGVLVDSGATTSALSIYAASELGLDLSDADRYPRFDMTGVVPGAKRPATEAEVLVELGGQWLPIPVAFTLDMDPTTATLGRRGVFDNVIFAFGHAERAVLCAV